MPTHAVITTGGKQYLVTEGQSLQVEKLVAEPKSTLKFEPLLIMEGDNVKVGMPKVAGSNVEATVVSHGLGKKLYVETYKAKTRKHRKIGHRQQYTKIQIGKISG